MTATVDGSGGRGERLIALLENRRFADTTWRLEGGFHFSRYDGDHWTFIGDHFGDLTYFFDRRGFTLRKSESYAYLEPDTSSNRGTPLGAREMVAGTAAALIYLSGGAVEGMSFEDFADATRTMLGGDDSFISIFNKRLRRGAHVTAARQETASENLRKTLRILARLGFVSLDGRDADMTVQPRLPCLRFAEVVEIAAGEEDGHFAEALDTLVAQNRFFVTTSGSDDRDYDSPDEDDDE